MMGRVESWRKATWGCVIATAASVLALTLWFLGALDTFEARSWDWRVGMMAAPAATTDQVVIIALDQPSLDWGEQDDIALGWPWPREAYATIVAFCERAGAAAIGFDVIFSEASRFGPPDDQLFGDSVSTWGHVAMAVPLMGGAADRSWPAVASDPRFTVEGAPVRWTEARTFPSAVFPVPELTASSAVLANVSSDPDADGVYRRSSLMAWFDGRPVPTLSLATYLAAHPEAAVRISDDALSVDGHEAPVDRDGATLLRFRGPSRTHKSFSAAAIIRSELMLSEGQTPTVDPSALRGKYVLFGFTAPGLFDIKAAPTGPYPGLEVHATALDNLLADDFMVAAGPLTTTLWVLLLALGAGVVAILAGSVLRTVLAQVAMVALPVLLSLGAYRHGLWLPLVPAELAAVVSLVGAGVVNYALEGRQKRFLKGAFKQYLSPIYIEQLIAHPERLRLGGERRELSIFFSDLQGFTTISEGLAPEDLTALLNAYLTEMTDLVQSEGGTVDKYEGDAIIAFWNAPLDQPDHAVRAVRAALRCQEALDRLRPEFHARYGCNLVMRIGINTGPAVVGNLGSRSRFDYSMLGDAVNLAARLEGINKLFGTTTIISQSTRDALADAVAARKIGRVAVVGRKEPVTVYEPMLADEAVQRGASNARFDVALADYERGDFASAVRAFEALADHDVVAAAYASTCQALAEQPPESWQGVWVATSK